MNNKKFSAGAWFLSAIGAVLGGILSESCLLPGTWQGHETPIFRVVWCGAFFTAVFVGGFLGLCLWMRLNRTCKVIRPKGWLASFLLSGALLFAAGAGGEALFMYTKEDVSLSGGVDLVLLLDASGSMDTSGYSVPRTQAACQFVDGLSDECRVQAVSFASIVLDQSPLSDMDDRGKTIVKEFIQGIDSVGATDFNAPLRAALDTLEREGRDDCHHAVLLLTDGAGELSAETVESFRNSRVKVFSVRIGSPGASDSQARALADFAAATGGFDTCLTPDAGGNVEASELLEAFQNAFQAVNETRTVMSDDMLTQSGPVSIYQFLVRLVTLMVCSALFGLGYFGQLQWPALGLNLACGLVTDVFLSFTRDDPEFEAAYLVVLCILIGSAFIRLNREGSEVIHV